MSGGAFGGLAAFDSFNDGVLRAAGGDAESVAGDADGLMMAGVDREGGGNPPARGPLRGSAACREGIRARSPQCGRWRPAAGRVVDGQNGRDPAPAFRRARRSGTGCRSRWRRWLVEVVRILQKKLIDIFAGMVGGSALGDRVLAVLVRVDVRRTAGKQNGLTGIDEVGDRHRGRVQRDLDGLAAAAFDCSGVVRPGALVVGNVCAGGCGMAMRGRG